jgi:hypothetical protein
VKSILLINPLYEMETLRVTDESRLDAKADNMPLHLATVAALTPDRFQVEIWDEFVRGPIENSAEHRDRHYDLVGITTIRVTFLRARELAAHFHARGIPVIVGGPGVSGSPDRFEQDFDIMFIGEVELTWPQFLNEWEQGKHKKVYRQIEKPDISASPMPRWDLIASDIDKYTMGSVQTTRGCPFDCEFCDVIFLFGRKPRHKPVERVLEEVKALQRLGVSTVYFADDDFVGHHHYAKELLHALIPLNNSFPEPLRFTTQASIDVSRDEELLDLMADANFYEMLIGIESSNPESLKEMGKFNNLKGDLVSEIHNVLSRGMSVRGALICGFDSDGPDIFDRQFQFIQKSCLPSLSLHMLNAPIGTRLWKRLQAQGRVLDIIPITDKFTRRIVSNVIPKQMTRVQLMAGFRDLYANVFNWRSFTERMVGFISLNNRPPKLRLKNVTEAELLALADNASVDAEGREAITRIARTAAEKAPHLMGRVRELVVQFIRYSRSARKLIPKLDRQIELESTGQIVLHPDARPITVPAAFRKDYHRVFPKIHSRVYRNLRDKSLVPAAIVDTFVDFFVHEESVESVSDHHLEMLIELADRTCADLNGVKPEQFVPNVEETPVPTVSHRLGDDVLNTVEQELIKLASKTSRDTGTESVAC